MTTATPERTLGEREVEGLYDEAMEGLLDGEVRCEMRGVPCSICHRAHGPCAHPAVAIRIRSCGCSTALCADGVASFRECLEAHSGSTHQWRCRYCGQPHDIALATTRPI